MESTQNLILEKYQMSDLPGDSLTHKLENVKKLVKEEIRKELKIKEGKNVNGVAWSISDADF